MEGGQGGRGGGGRQGPIHLLGSPEQASLEDGLTSGDIGGKYFSCFEKPSRAGAILTQVPPTCRQPLPGGEERRDTGLDFFSDKIISYQLIQSCDDTTRH